MLGRGMAEESLRESSLEGCMQGETWGPKHWRKHREEEMLAMARRDYREQRRSISGAVLWNPTLLFQAVDKWALTPCAIWSLGVPCAQDRRKDTGYVATPYAESSERSPWFPTFSLCSAHRQSASAGLTLCRGHAWRSKLREHVEVHTPGKSETRRPGPQRPASGCVHIWIIKAGQGSGVKVPASED